ncbi:uncharacterized protein PITG_07496 [Phytophthora infestans T30-4]|uniref:Uncharacterized protein n=1 Tax=Phytophthora infestans (strain T30-4) TaxID=403677 RepID=D0N8I4_PHYIT|nr:uncharacterized protein PITG_07496 [Phytophthora infestans T30-4]EEY53869.1 conserved hypothetical protein [Phytophthora infestans T30-4]|eukprot:XP_002904500.1 conserved hypothetical protein [Phytophthora infestans T30-4]
MVRTAPLPGAAAVATAAASEAVTTEAPSSTLKSTSRRRKRPPTRTLPQHEEATTTITEVVQSVLNDLVSRVSGEFSLPTRHRKRKSNVEKLTSSEGSKEKSRKRLKSANDKPAKRGKPVMSEEKKSQPAGIGTQDGELRGPNTVASSLQQRVASI